MCQLDYFSRINDLIFFLNTKSEGLYIISLANVSSMSSLRSISQKVGGLGNRTGDCSVSKSYSVEL